MPALDLSIVIPTNNRADLLRMCLESLRRHAPKATEIIIVDDGSDGATSRDVARAFDARCLRRRRRAGFCIAVNEGIAAAAGRIIEILNDDTEVTAQWAHRALALFEDAEVGAVAPLVWLARSGSDARLIDSAGDRYYVGGVATKRGHRQRASRALLQRCHVFGASGSSAFYRRAALEAVGNFPEHFGAYFEDADLAFRLHRAGYSIVFEPGSQVYHHGGSSYGRASRRLIEQQSANEERVFWRNLPAPTLCRTLHKHLAVLAGKAWRRYQEGTLAPFVSGRLRALAEAPDSIRHRRALQRRHPAADVSGWQVDIGYWGREPLDSDPTRFGYPGSSG